MIRRMFDNKMNEVTFTISHRNDCPESLFWKFGPNGNVYVCTAKSKLTGDYNISIIQDYTKIPNWCPLLNQKNYITKVTGELL